MKKFFVCTIFMFLLFMAVGCNDLTIDEDSNDLINNGSLQPFDPKSSVEETNIPPLIDNEKPTDNENKSDVVKQPINIEELEIIAPYPKVQYVKYFNSYQTLVDFINDNPHLKKYKEIYNEEYFITYDLIFYLGYETHYLIKQYISSVLYEDPIIIINMETRSPEIIPMVMAPAYYFYPIEVDKVSSLEKIIVNFKHIHPSDKFYLGNDKDEKALFERLNEDFIGITVHIEFSNNDEELINEHLELLKSKFSGDFSQVGKIHYIDYAVIPLDELNELILLAKSPEFSWIIVKVHNYNQ